MTFERSGVLLLALSSLLVCLASSITVPVPGQPILRQHHQMYQQPVRTVRIHRSGSVPVYRNVRLRNMPVKRIYVPVKVPAHPQRYVSSPPGGYKLGPPPPQLWKQKDFRQPHLQHHHPQQQLFKQHVPHNLNLGPPRKARHPKPKYASKPSYPKYPKKQHQQLQHHQQTSSGPSFDSYNPQGYPGGLVTDSYGAPKTANYRPPSTTYGKPHPLLGSPEPPKKSAGPSSAQLAKDEPATSYVNVYQGDKASEDGEPTYGFSQSHTYEKKHKGKVYSDNESLVTNHRPVYKHKSDTVSAGSSQSVVVVGGGSSRAEDDEDTITGTIGGSSVMRKKNSFQPPKQTYGFQPYEETRRGDQESGETGSYGPSQPAQQYYKKQPDTVLGPNYFEQTASTKPPTS